MTTIYKPTVKISTVNPAVAKLVTAKPVINPSYNPAPTAESILNELDGMTLLMTQISRTLGNKGPLRDLPALAVKLMTELNVYRAKK